MKKLLAILSFLILTTPLIAQDKGKEEVLPLLKEGENITLINLERYYNLSTLKEQLYTNGKVNSCTQGVLERKDLENEEVAVIRYGNHVNKGLIGQIGGSDFYPPPGWASEEILRKINKAEEEAEENTKIVFPDLPPEKLAEEIAKAKSEARKIIRNETGYSYDEQTIEYSNRLKKEEKAKGRPLTKDEKDALWKTTLKNFPVKEDENADENEALIIFSHTSIWKVFKYFRKYDQYKTFLKKYYKESLILTEKDLEKRGLLPKPLNVEVQYCELKIDLLKVEYVANLEATYQMETRKLTNGQRVIIPIITVAWETNHYFDKEKRHQEDPTQFGNENIRVNSGYLTLEPYINANHEVATDKVIAVYHTYMKAIEDVSGYPDYFREGSTRKFVQAAGNFLRKETSPKIE